MNVLVLGSEEIEQVLINLCKKSKFLDHIYTASNEPLEEIPNIEYQNYDELVHKAKALHIDLVLIANKNFIKNGLVEYLRKNKINTISVNQKWFNLESSRLITKQLLNHYSINTAEIIKVPKTFPVVIKTNKPFLTKIAYSMNELVRYREEINEEQVFLEEYLQGEVCYLLSLWDGKTLLHFDPEKLQTEVQEDRFNLLKTKLNIMFSDETPDFIGFFITKLIWAKHDWHVLDFIMHLDNSFDLSKIKQDFLYILNSAIYQKLNEIE